MRQMLTRLNKLSIKIPAMLIASAFIAALAIGANSYWNASKAILDSETDLTESTAQYRARVLTDFGETLAVDVGIAASSPTIRDALDFFKQVYDPKLAREGVYTRHYVERQAASADLKAQYNGDEDKTTYGIAHKRWHPLLQSVTRDKRLYDLFLIDMNG